MSNLIVEICAVEEIVPITGADRIERVRVKNWWCVASKGQYQIGDRAVYVPPDSVLPTALAERWGIAKHCSLLPKQINGERPDGLRVRAAKFLGAPSFGTLQTPDDSNWTVGTDVREHYGIVKYEPPPKICTGDIAPEDPLFHCYSSMKRFGDYPGVFADGEEVIVTEKLHGTNSRVGYVF
jgi:RNA ligase (TIGR02306 family)